MERIDSERFRGGGALGLSRIPRTVSFDFQHCLLTPSQSPCDPQYQSFAVPVPHPHSHRASPGPILCGPRSTCIFKVIVRAPVLDLSVNGRAPDGHSLSPRPSLSQSPCKLLSDTIKSPSTPSQSPSPCELLSDTFQSPSRTLRVRAILCSPLQKGHCRLYK